MLALLILSSVARGPALSEFCHDATKEVCGDAMCRRQGFRWCEICDKCTFRETAVFKDEL